MAGQNSITPRFRTDQFAVFGFVADPSVDANWWESVCRSEPNARFRARELCDDRAEHLYGVLRVPPMGARNLSRIGVDVVETTMTDIALEAGVHERTMRRAAAGTGRKEIPHVPISTTSA